MREKKTCKDCGAMFSPRLKFQARCDSCLRQRNFLKNSKVFRVCKLCKDEFEVKNYTQKYCGEKCRIAANRYKGKIPTPEHTVIEFDEDLSHYRILKYNRFGEVENYGPLILDDTE